MSKILLILARGYIVILLAMLLLYRIIGDQWVPLTVPMAFLPLLFVPLPFALIIALVKKEVALVAVNLLAVGLFLAYFGGLFLNRPQQAPVNTPRLRVLSYNSLGTTAAVDEVTARVNQTNPDVIGIQEMSEGLASGLQQTLGADYPHQMLNPIGIPGMGIFSKYPMREIPFVTHSRWVGVPQAVEIGMPDGQKVAFLNAHLKVTAPYTTNPTLFWNTVDSTYREREKNATEIDAWWQQQTVPRVMVCDCNLTDWQDAYQMLRDAGLRDTWREVGFGMGATFPFTNSAFFLSFPMLRLDYVFHDSTWQPESIVKLAWDGASDHTAIFAVLAQTR